MDTLDCCCVLVRDRRVRVIQRGDGRMGGSGRAGREEEGSRWNLRRSRREGGGERWS